MAPDTVSELAALERQINESVTPTQKPELTIQAPPMRVEPPPTQAQPVKTNGVPIPADTPVPDKFKNPDGTFNDERLSKSLTNLDHYLKMEKELSQLKSQQSQPQTVQPPYQAPPQWASQTQPSFEQRLNEDLQKDPGTTIANVARAIAFEAEQKSSAQITELQRKLELMEIGARDPGVFTQEGAAALKQTLVENPWIWNAPNPWSVAYKLHGPISANGQQATAPARRPAAPILPGGPAPSIPQSTSITSEADLRRYLESKSPSNDPKGEGYMNQANMLENIIAEMAKNR
jgi:hypothetical protein